MSIRVNGKVIASNGDVKTETDNLVTTDTNQTITATKVFTAEQQRKSAVIDITTQPEKYTTNNAFRFLDKNDQISGYIENGQMASGEITTGILARNKDGYQPRVSVFAPLSGTTGAYATAPNTPENAPANAITTVDYVKNNFVDTTSNQTISGTKTFTQVINTKTPIAAAAGEEAVTAGWAIKNLTYVSLPTAANMVSLTIGASGTEYTAPDDGWFAVYAAGGQSNSCQLINTITQISISTPGITGFTDAKAFIPARKGETVQLKYTGILLANTAWFRFYRGGTNNVI